MLFVRTDKVRYVLFACSAQKATKLESIKEVARMLRRYFCDLGNKLQQANPKSFKSTHV